MYRAPFSPVPPAATGPDRDQAGARILQPLCEEFLYRPPQDPATHTGRWFQLPAVSETADESV